MKHPSIQYAQGVLCGKVLACRWVRLACQRYIDDLKNGHKRGLLFDYNAADHALEFFSHLKLWKGAGYKDKEFVLAPHFQFIASNIMGWKWKDSNTRRFRTAYIEMGRKGAKAEYVENLIPTTEGFKRMADIHGGDFVYGSDGRPVMVIATTEVMYNKKCMEVEFSSGEKIIVSADHLWPVNKRIEPKSKNAPWTKNEDDLIRELYSEGGANAIQEAIPSRSRYALQKRAQIIGVKKMGGKHNRSVAKLHKSRIFHMPESENILCTEIISKTLTCGARGDNRYTVDVAPTMENNFIFLPIPPYTLGAWLGDGDSSGARITIGYKDVEIINSIKLDGIRVKEGRSSNINSGLFYLSGQTKAESVFTKLKKLGVIKNKHIPIVYLRSTKSQRMNLLRGLMDTDGTVDMRGRCSFTNCNKQLAYDFKHLVCSLGMKATLTEKPAKLNGKYIRRAYQIVFYPPKGIQLFALHRKQRRVKERKKKTRTDSRSIVAIRLVKSVPVRCITVNALDGIYLTGESCIPTHNSTFAGGLGAYFFVADGEQGAEIYAAAVKKEQAKIVWTNIKNLTKKSMFAKLITYHMHNMAIENTWSKCEPLSSETKSLDGLDTHYASLDELHAHPTPEVHDLVVDSVGARAQPLVLIITTAGFDQSGICYSRREYLTKILRGVIQDDSFFGVIYTLDTKRDWPDLVSLQEKQAGKKGVVEDDWTNEDLWVKPMPGLCGVTKNGKRYGVDKNGNSIPGYMTKIEDVRNKAKVAKEIVSAQNNFLTKRMNVWTQQFTRWIDLTLWDENLTKEIYCHD